MVIECPNCETRFRFDESRFTAPRVRLKCARCQTVFPFAHPNPQNAPRRAAPMTPPGPAAKTEARSGPAQRNLSFPFEEEWGARTLDDAKVPEDGFSLDIEPAAPAPRPAARAPRNAPLIPLSDEYCEDEEDFGEEAAAAPAVEKGQAADEAEKVGTRVLPVLLFVYFVVIPAYVIFSIALYNNPAWAEQIARKLPFIGSLNRDRLLNRKVVLGSVQGTYERIKEGRDVFLVRGEATNHASVPLSSIQVLVKVLDGQGRLMEERTVFCGGDLPKKLLRDLSQVEASIIGQLKPPKTFVVQPGDRSPFVVVFTDLPSTVGDYSAQVYAAQR